MNVKFFLRHFYLTSYQIKFLIKISQIFFKIPLIGKILSIWVDNLILHLYGVELKSTSLFVKDLVIGHSTGLVLGGNGITCSGKLHVSSGVVFARRYNNVESVISNNKFFEIDGDLTIGANSVLLGPLKIKGPVIIGAMSLVSHDINQPGIYVGSPAKLIKKL